MQSTGNIMLTPVPRHPLGLPPGSVRAVLSLIIVGLFWLILLLPQENALHCAPSVTFST